LCTRIAAKEVFTTDPDNCFLDLTTTRYFWLLVFVFSFGRGGRNSIWKLLLELARVAGAISPSASFRSAALAMTL